MLLLQLKGHADNILKVTGRHSKTMTFLIYHFEGYRVMAPREEKKDWTVVSLILEVDNKQIL